ncbi:MAG: FMN-dependent oxidoreductase (nitrilotriacetate monooxygenase family) [Gammaproteobacteria bacterium]|jgi:FMN-dependent oxidoreductase (nitrilotriacetate monooxygenase family)
MNPDKKMRLGAFMRPVSIHTAAWRYPGAFKDANFNFRHYQRFVAALERGCFDAFFMADHLAVLNMPMNALKRSATVSSFDPLTLLPALAVTTEHIGLVATASTTYNEPYHVARKFASLDHISEGRAGWNVVTSANPDEALNFGLEQHMAHDKRYARAHEFYKVVTGLWDSWADDAFIHDADNGIYFDPEKLNVLNHRGPHLKVRGPLNIARPIQGWPVIVQAGASEAGRELAAETAEVVFGGANNLNDAMLYYADLKRRMAKFDRDSDALKILPGAFVVVGDTIAEAQAKKEKLDSLVHPDSGIATLSVLLGCDVSNLDLDGPLPELAESNASKSGQKKLIDMAYRENLTVGQLAQYVGGSFSSLEIVGTPTSIVDQMEEWFLAGGCDGFNIMFPYLPDGLDDFVDKIVPELQRRKLFRTEYEGKTLRENLGLLRPPDKFSNT